MDFDWKKILGTVAPVLGAAVAGPLGGMALKAIGDALGLDEATEATIATALKGATPDDLLKVKQADQAFQTRMAELGVDLEKIAQQDRSSARDMQKGSGSQMPAILAIAVTIGFFGVLALMLVGDFKPQNNDAFLLLLGSLGTAWTAIIAFYFGSSQGSVKSAQALRDIAQSKG